MDNFLPGALVTWATRKVLYWAHTLFQEMTMPETLCSHTSPHTLRGPLVKAFRLPLNYPLTDTWHVASRNVFNTRLKN